MSKRLQYKVIFEVCLEKSWYNGRILFFHRRFADWSLQTPSVTEFDVEHFYNKSDGFLDRISALGVCLIWLCTAAGHLSKMAIRRGCREEVARFNCFNWQSLQIWWTTEERCSFCVTFIFWSTWESCAAGVTKHTYKIQLSRIHAALLGSLDLLKERLSSSALRQADLGVVQTFCFLEMQSFYASNGAGLGGVLVGPDGLHVSWLAFMQSRRT